MTGHGVRRLVCVTSTGVPMRPPPGETLVRSVVELITTEGTPSVYRVFLKEALRIGSA